METPTEQVIFNKEFWTKVYNECLEFEKIRCFFPYWICMGSKTFKEFWNSGSWNLGNKEFVKKARSFLSENKKYSNSFQVKDNWGALFSRKECSNEEYTSVRRDFLLYCIETTE